MRLNGWQRLWVVTSALCAPPVAVVAWHQFPRPEQIVHQFAFYERLPKESLAKLKYTVHEILDLPAGVEITATSGNDLLFLEGVPEKEAQTVVGQYYAILRTEATKKILVIVGLAIAAWLLCCASVYLMGSVIAWVRRGFRGE